MAGPYAIRVRTPDGWQDLALTGPAGPTGPAGQGRELAAAVVSTDSGPTGVTTTGAGDSLVDLGSITTRNVPHWWQSTLLVKSSVANEALFLLLYDGTPASPGSAVAYSPLYAPTAGGLLACVRLRFTPAAGTRNYHVRWRNQGTGTTLFTILNSLYQGTHTITEVAS